MKWKIMLFVSLLILGCATRNDDWDSGAQKQEAEEQGMREQQEDVFRNQFPGGRF